MSAERWGFWVKFVLTPIIVFFGTIGNSLSLIVMKSKGLRHKSYSQLLSVLAIFDTLTLILRQIQTIDQFLDHGIFKGFNDFGCKLYNFIEHIAYLMSSWLIVFMAVERVLAVCLPFKKFRIRRQSGATASIVLLFIAICLSQAFRLVMVEQYGETCASSDNFFLLYTNLHLYFYYMTLTFILPVAIVLTCNALVLYQIFKVKQEVKKENTRNREHRAVRKTQRTTCMLLIVSGTFLLTLLPLLTLSLVVDITVKTKGKAALSFYKSMVPYLDLVVALSLVNYGVNFFIYILSGKSFRYELRKVFYGQKPRATRSITARSTKEEIIRL